MDQQNTTTEEFRVSGRELVEKIKEIVRAGNARRIILKNDQDKVIMELPLTFGVAAAVLAPMLAAVGAVAALVTKCTLIVEKRV